MIYLRRREELASTRLGSPLTCLLVECSLEILQSSALGQVGQTRVLQGPGLGGLSNDRSAERVHVPAAKLLSLQLRERFGEILVVGMRQITPTRASISARETRGTVCSIDRQNLSCWIAAIALGCGLHGAGRQIEQAVEGFDGLDGRDLWGCRLAGHGVPHPPLKS